MHFVPLLLLGYLVTSIPKKRTLPFAAGIYIPTVDGKTQLPRKRRDHTEIQIMKELLLRLKGASFKTVLSAVLVLLVLPSVLGGCTEDAWKRGQPPGVPTLVKRSQTRLGSALRRGTATRKDVADTATELRTSMTTALRTVKKGGSKETLVRELNRSRDAFMKLEGKLSVGSRAGYGELSGQMRVFADRASRGETIEYASFGLFTARTFFFLANELSVPAPTVG